MDPSDTRRHLINISVLWVVLSAIGEFLANVAIAHYPGTQSSQGLVTSDAFFFLLRITVPVLVLIMLVIVYAAIRFRVPDGDTVSSPKQYRSSRAFPWTWVSVSTVLNLLFIYHPGITGLESLWSMTAAAANPMEIDITAKQWDWQFTYPGQKLKGEGDLVVPINMPIRFVLNTADVIHSFWVPAWGIKKAIIPGETRTLVVTPNQLIATKSDPLARVQCSQICGVGHADMHAVVRVVSAADFKKWVATEQQSSDEQSGGMNMGGSGGMNMKRGGAGGMKMQGGKGMKMQGGDGAGAMEPKSSGPGAMAAPMKMKPDTNGGMMMNAPDANNMPMTNNQPPANGGEN